MESFAWKNSFSFPPCSGCFQIPYTALLALLSFQYLPKFRINTKKKKKPHYFSVSISHHHFFLNKVSFFFFFWLHFILDWESQPKAKESTPMQDILEENSSHDLQMVRFTAGDPLLPLIGEVDDTRTL